MTLRARLALLTGTVVVIGGLVTGGTSAVIARDQALSRVASAVNDALDLVRRDPQSDVSGIITFADASGVPLSAQLYFEDGSPISLVDGTDEEGPVRIGTLTVEEVKGAVGSNQRRTDPSPVVLGALPTDTREWVVVAGSTREVDREFRNSLARSLTVSLLVAMTVSLLMWFLIARTLRPIFVVTERASRIAAGDLDVELPVSDQSNEIGRLTGSLSTMVSSLREAVHVTTRSEERMREFLGDASHELRTPLTVIRGYVEMLASGREMSPEQRERATRRLVEESQRMTSIIEDLLLLAELGEVAQPPASEVDFSLLVEERARDLAEQYPQRPVFIDVPQGVMVVGNAEYLERAVTNIYANIVRHTPETARVEVTMETRPGTVTVSFDDAGPGLPEEMYARMPEGFRRYDISRSRDGGGFGLGLSIIATVVDQLGGTFVMSPSRLGGLRTVIQFPRS